ncbi:MAG: Smr/MutS family protein [Rhodobacteraceae bacterium]|nr:Smr/MutS family protein [Paracoccaceae bacterium]
MNRRRPRALSREDRNLWDQVARQARPMHAARAPNPQEPEPSKPMPTPAPGPRSQPIAPFQIGARSGSKAVRDDLSGPIADRLAQAPVKMDHKAFTRMKGGRLDPEARIDLHGMTLAQAHPALNAFILRNQAAGRRLVLVITGKGRTGSDDGPIPERRGVLKRQVPHWLHQAPVAQAVLQIAQAHRRHGGDGAYYVYLRRAR